MSGRQNKVVRVGGIRELLYDCTFLPRLCYKGKEQEGKRPGPGFLSPDQVSIVPVHLDSN